MYVHTAQYTHVLCMVLSVHTHGRHARVPIYVTRLCETQTQLLPETREIPWLSPGKKIVRRLNIPSTPFGPVQKFCLPCPRITSSIKESQ